MDLQKIQKMNDEFGKERGWNKFPASQVFTHLIEELGEISRHITIEEGYKAIGLGHDAPTKNELKREFAQVLSLFLQLANHFEIDLEDAILAELKTMADRFPADEWTQYMAER
ncbi:MAG: MazG nucleotide pyrophosphohydrolase domain-containing protein [Candidatus Thorarchaeota archaeon]